MSLAVTLTPSATSISSGDVVTFTAEVENTGLADVKVLDVRAMGSTALVTPATLPSLGLTVLVPVGQIVTFEYSLRLFQDNQSISVRAYGSDGSVASAVTSILVS